MGIIADVAALARAGYTMADIRELMTTKEPEDPKEEDKKESTPPEERKLVDDPKVEPQPDTSKDDEYKIKYEELLAKTQAENRKANFGGEPDNRTDEQKAIDILAAIF